MKGLTETLWIVVASLVIVVVALIILTIFAKVIPLFSSLTEFNNYCTLKAKATCTMGSLPPDWESQVNVGGQIKTCKDVAGATCADITGQSPVSGG